MKEEEFNAKHARLVLKTHADLNRDGERVLEDWSAVEFRHFVLAQLNQLHERIDELGPKEKSLIQVV